MIIVFSYKQQCKSFSQICMHSFVVLQPKAHFVYIYTTFQITLADLHSFCIKCVLTNHQLDRPWLLQGIGQAFLNFLPMYICNKRMKAVFLKYSFECMNYELLRDHKLSKHQPFPNLIDFVEMQQLLSKNLLPYKPMWKVL